MKTIITRFLTHYFPPASPRLCDRCSEQPAVTTFRYGLRGENEKTDFLCNECAKVYALGVGA